MIRIAKESDIDEILGLLEQILEIHHEGRPDLFKAEGSKFTKEELSLMIQNPEEPIFVYEDESGHVAGHCFCSLHREAESNSMHAVNNLFIHDLCVSETCRGKGIGEQLFRYVEAYAKRAGMDAVTLNVWGFNRQARAFYQKMGMTEQRIIMEIPIKNEKTGS